MPMVTASPQPMVMLVNPPWMTSPGFFAGNSTTMATTPLPNRIRTNVPRNSARSSAVKPGFEFIESPAETGLVNREVVYQADEGARFIFCETTLPQRKRGRFLRFRNLVRDRGSPHSASAGRLNRKNGFRGHLPLTFHVSFLR